MEIFTFRYRGREEEYEDPRRAFLVRALTMGLFAAGGRWLWPAGAHAMSAGMRELGPGQSIHRIRGDVRIGGVAADIDTPIGPADSIETGPDAELVFVVGKDAFILREAGALELTPLDAAATAQRDGPPADTIVAGLRLITGKLLSVFGARAGDEPLSLRTPVATVGIRGTGLYLESEPERSYVCTCYGDTLLRARDDPSIREAISTTHHDAPRYIVAEGMGSRRIRPAPVINHTDMELSLIESLVGRRPPFAVGGGGGGAGGGGY